MQKSTHDKTHFGFKEVDPKDKAGHVAEVFHSVASQYDLMNDLMSFGMHRLWKRFAINQCGIRPGQMVLDLAGGTGDLTKRLVKKVGATGTVVLADINEKMLMQGRNRLLDEGILQSVLYAQTDAECLPFNEATFDCVCIAFGLRNVTDKQRALSSMYTVLKPGGKLIILEFSNPTVPLLKSIYDRYSFNMIPKLGELVCNDRASYQYLVESIRMHPDQATLKQMMQKAQFEDVNYYNLAGGIVALHKGYKYE